MKERPILFSTDMVKAVLDDRKTQTRRVVKFKLWPEIPVVEMTEHFEPYSNSPKNEQFWSADHKTEGKVLVEQGLYCPYGVVGDRLWVRETFRVCDVAGEPFAPKDIKPTNAHCFYKADAEAGGSGKWRPSIFMPKWAARIWLEITNVRVERVQDISEADTKAEGVIIRNIGETYWRAFHNLWDSLNAKRGYGWEKNPWVWVIEFKRVRDEI